MRSVIAEAVAGHDMYLWNICLGFPGSLNDTQVLGRSTITGQYLESPAATVEYHINGEKFTGAYLLADGIYPPEALFMKSILHPKTRKECLFAKFQEACRKDVERAFGRMLNKWHILSCAARTWLIENVRIIWRACFILHNITLRAKQTEVPEPREDIYDSDDEARRGRELRRENARVRAERQESRVRRGNDRRLEEEAEMAEGGEGEKSTCRRMERIIKRRAQARRRLVRDGPPVMRRKGRVAVEPRQRPTISQLCDEADDQADMNGEGVDMSVPPSDWSMVLEALGHIQCAETMKRRRDQTMEALWAWKGDGVGED